MNWRVLGFVAVGLFVVISMILDVIAAVAIAAGVLLLLVSRDQHYERPRDVCLARVFLPACVFLTVLAGIGFAEMASGLVGLLKEPGSQLWLLAAATYCSGVALAVYFAYYSTRGISDQMFLLVIVLSAAVLRFWYASTIDVLQVSDFARMAQAASEIANNGLAQFSKSDEIMDALYQQRVVFYLLPFQTLFDDAPFVIPLANISFVCGTLFLTYFLFQALGVDAKTARVAVVLASAVPETFLVVNVATHDVPAAFWLIANMLVLTQFSSIINSESRRWGSIIVLALLFTTIFFVEIQRSIGLLVAVIDLLVVAIICMDGDRSRSFYRYTLVLATAVTLWAGLACAHSVEKKFGAESDAFGRHRAVYMLAHSDPGTDGSFGYWQSEWQNADSPDNSGTYAFSRLGAGLLVDPFDYIPMLVRKMSRVALLGTQHRYYLNGAIAFGEPISFEVRRALYVTVNSSTAIFWMFFAYGLVLAFKDSRDAVYPGVYIALFIVALLVMSEVQPRYIYFVWYAASLYVSLAIGHVFFDKSEAH